MESRRTSRTLSSAGHRTTDLRNTRMRFSPAQKSGSRGRLGRSTPALSWPSALLPEGFGFQASRRTSKRRLLAPCLVGWLSVPFTLLMWPVVLTQLAVQVSVEVLGGLLRSPKKSDSD